MLRRRVRRTISRGSFYKFLGIILSMALFPQNGSRDVYWRHETEIGSIDFPPDYGQKYGMGYREFSEILYNLRLTSYNDEDVEQVCLSCVFMLCITNYLTRIHMCPLMPSLQLSTFAELNAFLQVDIC